MPKDNLQKPKSEYTTFQSWVAVLFFPLMLLGPFGFIIILVLLVWSGLWNKLVKHYTDMFN